MTIITKTDGTTTTLAVSGWLDTSTAPELAKAVDAIDAKTTKLIVDLDGLEYISSAGLRQLVAAYKKMSGNLEVINVSSEIRYVLHMAGFDKLLNIA